MKTTAIRLEDELYAQLTIVAQLEGQTVTDAIRAAVLGYIEQRKTALSSQADTALAEIERDAAIRRQAITDLFGGGAAPVEAVETDKSSASRSRTSRKDGQASDS